MATWIQTNEMNKNLCASLKMHVLYNDLFLILSTPFSHKKP